MERYAIACYRLDFGCIERQVSNCFIVIKFLACSALIPSPDAPVAIAVGGEVNWCAGKCHGNVYIFITSTPEGIFILCYILRNQIRIVIHSNPRIILSRYNKLYIISIADITDFRIIRVSGFGSIGIGRCASIAGRTAVDNICKDDHLLGVANCDRSVIPSDISCRRNVWDRIVFRCAICIGTSRKGYACICFYLIDGVAVQNSSNVLVNIVFIACFLIS